jgi:hypothetical protein
VQEVVYTPLPPTLSFARNASLSLVLWQFSLNERRTKEKMHGRTDFILLIRHGCTLCLSHSSNVITWKQFQ